MCAGETLRYSCQRISPVLIAHRELLARPSVAEKVTVKIIFFNMTSSFSIICCNAGGRLALEHRLDRCLGAFLAVRTGNSHCTDDLVIEHDGKCARLWEVAHKRRRQILAALNHLVGLRGGAPPAQGRLC